MLQRALDIYRSKFMPSLQPRKNSHRIAPIPPPTSTIISQQATLLDLLPTTPTVPLTADALSAQNALFEKINPSAGIGSPAMSNMSGTTESLDFADCFSLAEEEPSNKEEAEAAAAVFCNMLLQQEPMSFIDNTPVEETSSMRMNSTSSYSSDSTVCTPSPTTLPIQDPFTADFFDQFMMPTDDPFYMMDTTDLSKLYNTTIDQDLFSLDPLF